MGNSSMYRSTLTTQFWIACYYEDKYIHTKWYVISNEISILICTYINICIWDVECVRVCFDLENWTVCFYDILPFFLTQRVTIHVFIHRALQKSIYIYIYELNMTHLYLLLECVCFDLRKTLSPYITIYILRRQITNITTAQQRRNGGNKRKGKSAQQYVMFCRISLYIYIYN